MDINSSFTKSSFLRYLLLPDRDDKYFIIQYFGTHVHITVCNSASLVFSLTEHAMQKAIANIFIVYEKKDNNIYSWHLLCDLPSTRIFIITDCKIHISNADPLLSNLKLSYVTNSDLRRSYIKPLFSANKICNFSSSLYSHHVCYYRLENDYRVLRDTQPSVRGFVTSLPRTLCRPIRQPTVTINEGHVFVRYNQYLLDVVCVSGVHSDSTVCLT